MRGFWDIGERGGVYDRRVGDNRRVVQVVKDGMELLGLEFKPCVKGASAVWGSTTVGYGPGPARA